MEKYLLGFDAATPVDLVIANAGIFDTSKEDRDDIATATRKHFAVNVDGVFNTILPLIPRMQVRNTRASKCLCRCSA